MLIILFLTYLLALPEGRHELGMYKIECEVVPRNAKQPKAQLSITGSDRIQYFAPPAALLLRNYPTVFLTVSRRGECPDAV